MSDAIPNGPTGEWGDLDETAWQQMHAGTVGPIGPVELGMLADSHAALAKLHKDDAGLFAGHSERAAELRRFSLDLAWFVPQPPPQPILIDDRLEAALLGELMTSRLFHPLPADLSAHDFGDPVHAAIYAAMKRCHAKKVCCSLDNVAADLRDLPDLEEVGGTAYLVQLAKADPIPHVAIAEAARIISETAHARSLMADLHEVGAIVRTQSEIVPIDLAAGAGRGRAHLLAMELIGIAHRMLDQSAGWA